MPRVASTGVYAPYYGNDDVERLSSISLRNGDPKSIKRPTIAKSTHQSSHHGFRVSFTRVYIRETTKAREVISSTQVKA